MGQKHDKISGISDAISPARHPQKSSQHVRACTSGDGAILKIELLSHIMGTTPILEMARVYGLRPRLWLLVIMIFTDRIHLKSCFSILSSHFPRFWQTIYPEKLSRSTFSRHSLEDHLDKSQTTLGPFD